MPLPQGMLLWKVWPSFAICRGSLGSSCKSLSGRCYLHASQLSETEPLPFIMPHKVQTSPSRNFQLRCKARPQHGHQQFADHFQPPRNQEPMNLNVWSPATPGCALCQTQSGRHGWHATAGPEPSQHSCAGSSANSQTICSTSIPLHKPGTKLYFKESNFRNKNSLCPVREGRGREVTSNKGLLCARGHTHDTAISLYYIWICVYSCVHLLYVLCIYAHTWQELCTMIPLLYTGIIPNLCAHICPQDTKKIHTTT